MNLRNYKNTTQFNATDAWNKTTLKQFNPTNQYQATNSFLGETNRGFKKEFKDKHAERNAGEIMHMVRKNDVYSNIGWMTNLRGDREARIK